MYVNIYLFTSIDFYHRVVQLKNDKMDLATTISSMKFSIIFLIVQ